MRNQYKILSERYDLVKESEKEDILGGLDRFANVTSPESKIVHGIVTIGRRGGIVNYYTTEPYPCPKEAVYVASDMFVMPGQKIDPYNSLEVLVVNDEMARDLQMWNTGQLEDVPEEVEDALDELCKNLNINGDDAPVLPESEKEDILGGLDAANDHLNTKIYYLQSLAGSDNVSSGTFEEIWEELETDFTDCNSGECYIGGEGDMTKEEAFNYVVFEKNEWHIEALIDHRTIEGIVTTDKSRLLNYVNQRFTKLLQQINKL